MITGEKITARPVSVKLTNTSQTTIFTAIGLNMIEAAVVLYAANTTGTAATLTVEWTDSSASTTYTLLGTKLVAANDTLTVDLGFRLDASDAIKCTAGTGNALQITLLVTEKARSPG